MAAPQPVSASSTSDRHDTLHPTPYISDRHDTLHPTSAIGITPYANVTSIDTESP